MKKQVPIQLEEDLLEQIDLHVEKEVKFRNRSHFFEIAAYELIKKEVERNAENKTRN